MPLQNICAAGSHRGINKMVSSSARINKVSVLIQVVRLRQISLDNTATPAALIVKVPFYFDVVAMPLQQGRKAATLSRLD